MTDAEPGDWYVGRGSDIAGGMAAVVVPKLLGVDALVLLYLGRLLEYAEGASGLVPAFGALVLRFFVLAFTDLFPLVAMYFLLGLYLMGVGFVASTGDLRPDPAHALRLQKAALAVSAVYVGLVVLL